MPSEQDEFDALVREFNATYLLALCRAASGPDRWLVEQFGALRDWHDAILKTHDVRALRFRVPVYPLTIRGNETFYAELGFSGDEIAAIEHFLERYRLATGRAFDTATVD